MIGLYVYLFGCLIIGVITTGIVVYFWLKDKKQYRMHNIQLAVMYDEASRWLDTEVK